MAWWPIAAHISRGSSPKKSSSRHIRCRAIPRRSRRFGAFSANTSTLNEVSSDLADALREGGIPPGGMRARVDPYPALQLGEGERPIQLSEVVRILRHVSG